MSKFLLMHLRPPRSTRTDTRCPYTTPFRSRDRRAGCRDLRRRQRICDERRRIDRARTARLGRRRPDRRAARGLGEPRRRPAGGGTRTPRARTREMKSVKPAYLERQTRLDPAVRFTLLTGPDEATMEAVAARLIGLAGKEAERLDLTGSQLSRDPSLLAAEAASLDTKSVV